MEEFKKHHPDDGAKAKGRGLSIRRLNLVMIGLTLLLSALLLFATVRANIGYAEIRSQTEDYIRLQADAFDMQLGSDYLTEQVRRFAETGNTECVTAYFAEANSLRRRDKALEHLRVYFGDTQAFTTLEAAMEESLALMEQEYYSMRLTVAALGLDPADFPEEIRSVVLSERDAVLSPEEQGARARAMVFDDEYHASKAFIFDHIQLCLIELTQEIQNRQTATLDRLHELLTQQRTLIILSILFTIGTMLLTLLLVIRPLLRAVDYIRADQPVPITGSSEFRFLAGTYNLIYEKNREKEEQLTYEATHDRLTGLYNRAGYDFFLENVDLDSTALLLIDVDKFKGINDSYGHDIGDRVLSRVAEVIRSSFRAQDYVCRIGGDEFAVLLIHAEAAPSGMIVEKLERINRLLKTPGDDLPPVSLSCGVAFGSGVQSSKGLYKTADAALYRVKAGGGCGCEVHS